MTEKKQTPQSGRQVRIEIDDTVADGIYANLAMITSNNAEFILDFARFLPGNTRGKVVSRMVMSPIHAKILMQSLDDAISHYEKKNGSISSEQPNKNIGFHINRDENQSNDTSN